MYLLGQPYTDLGEGKEEYFAPVSQAVVCFEILKKFTTAGDIQERLRQEYIAIVYALKRMGVEFRILYGDGERIDKGLLGVCIELLGCRLSGASGFWLGGLLYPRDLFSLIGSVALFNSEAVGLLQDRVGDYLTIASPFGQGGRILARDNTMLVPQRINLEDKKSRWVTPEDILPMEQAGFCVTQLPQPTSMVLTRQEITSRVFFTDHLDRGMCLLKGRDGKLHLLAEESMVCASWLDRGGEPHWEPVLAPQSVDMVRRLCEPSGVVVHTAPKLKVPYALNLVQFADGRVLMTSGDGDATEAVERIIWPSRVCVTEIPIICYPVFAYAGIHCLMTEQPPTFKKVV